MKTRSLDITEKVRFALPWQALSAPMLVDRMAPCTAHNEVDWPLGEVMPLFALAVAPFSAPERSEPTARPLQVTHDALGAIYGANVTESLPARPFGRRIDRMLIDRMLGE